MIIDTVVELGLNVHDCIGLFAGKDKLLEVVANRLEGRCYGGYYIHKVVSLERVGDCMIDDRDPTIGTISLVCRIVAIQFAIGEIINGCKVVSRDDKGLVCTTNVAAIRVQPDPIIASIKPGQFISVRVCGVRYSQTQKVISVTAIPYKFSDKYTVYKLGPVSGARAIFADMRARMAFEETTRTNLQKSHAKSWDTFSKLLYAYKTPQATPPGATVVDLYALLDAHVAPKYVSRDPRMNLANATAYGYDAVPESPAYVEETMPAAQVILLLCEDYCAHLRTIREYISTYATDELLSAHDNYIRAIIKGRL